MVNERCLLISYTVYLLFNKTTLNMCNRQNNDKRTLSTYLISVISAGVSGSLKECRHQNLLLRKLACYVVSFLFFSFFKSSFEPFVCLAFVLER